MRIDARLDNALAGAAQSAAQAEELGLDGLWTGETNHDPFLPITVALEHTRTAIAGTAAAVAFARSPMNTAYLADDLQRFSGGRFVLGLGSQVEAHVTQRFSMPYSRPIGRLREYVAALREIWGAWREDREPDFRGDFYQHTLMPPVFSPGPTDIPAPPVYLAAVGPQMAKLAGEVGDGILVHQFSTPRYLREVILPSVQKGLAASGRPREEFEVVVPLFLVTAATEESFDVCRAAMRRHISFYASTPAYAEVLHLHGLSDLYWELFELSLTGGWTEMAELIDDDVLEVLALVGEPHTIARRLHARYGELADRIVFSLPPYSDAPWASIIGELRELSSRSAG
ncbi:putative F420-dependent oxidoreductase [Allocatelliglobosispora scoriae]|uniref:Putative F420-dependent oxidoreductase n=1 Tax=Allocatelliglobosispora scoriae TaxID=643052 RepID=A0A841BWB9_9ACTN|nr:TIGR03617 family F420-dependent LLM class oxidoreductase [Allocatelliglobosispora scoriae]MBB5871062.1 putative F420-dependent oxidoreductase [Allocatelliglobosispora scoriae]